MIPAELDPNLTQPWPSWFLQPQHMIRNLGWMFSPSPGLPGLPKWLLWDGAAAAESTAPSPGAVTQGCPPTPESPGLIPSTPKPYTPAHLQLSCCPSTITPTPARAASDTQLHSGLAVVSGGTRQELLAGLPLQHHLVITNKIIPKRLYLQIGKLIQKKVRSKPWCPAV